MADFNGLELNFPPLQVVAASAVLAAAKIWGTLDWPWGLVLGPLLALYILSAMAYIVAGTVVGVLAVLKIFWGPR